MVIDLPTGRAVAVVNPRVLAPVLSVTGAAFEATTKDVPTPLVSWPPRATVAGAVVNGRSADVATL